MTTPPPSGTTNAVVWAVTIVFVVTTVAVVAMAIAISDGARVATMVALVGGNLTATVASIIGILKISGVENKVGDVENRVADVHQNTHDLTNGLMDQKIRDGVRAEVASLFKPELLNPRAHAATETAAQLLARRSTDKPPTIESGDQA